MASVQWGATNSAFLAFTASAALRELPNGPGTIAILWKPVLGVANAADGVGMTDAAAAASTYYHTLVFQENAVWGDDCQAGAWVVSQTLLTAAHWYVAVVDWAGGAAATDRFHWIDLTAAGSWNHGDSSNNNGGGLAAPSSAWFRAGFTNDYAIGSGQQIALIAAWAGVRFSDANAEALTTNKRTSDWYNHAAGTPTFLSEITATSGLTDLGSGASAFSGANSVTTNLTVGGDPDGGWTFDGVGTPSTQTILPDADIATTGWSTAPLYSKINDSSDATVITATLA